MKAVWYERNGPAREVLVVGTMTDPEPGPGEVRVRLATSGVNPSDVKTRAGSRPMAGPRVVPHSDGAGIIDRVGAGVAQGRIGERVWIWNGQWQRPFGTAAEMIALPAAQAVPLPPDTTFDQGACLGIPALTAFRAVTVDGSIAGASVLVAGGAGAVGHYVIQFARALGARQVIATVSSPAKAEHALAAGADLAVDYRREDVVEKVREATAGRGVDRVVEVDAATNLRLLPRLVARGGLCVVYGSSRSEVVCEFGPMIMSGVAVRWFIVYELPWPARQQAVTQLGEWLAAGRIRHAIDSSYPLEEAAAAHERVESSAAIGNVVITV
jgi:NADPH2:quinone reductase